MQVKQEELIPLLIQLRESFMDWDNERRKKVDIVLHALNSTDEVVVNLEETLKNIELLGIQDSSYTELVPAAKKLLRLHYCELSRTPEKIKTDNERYERARQKMEVFKKKGLL